LVFLPREEKDLLVDLVRQEMEGVFLLKVPLKVDITVGRNWDESLAQHPDQSENAM